MKSPSSIRSGVTVGALLVAVSLSQASCRGPLPPEPASAVPSEQPASTLVDVAGPEQASAADAGAPAPATEHPAAPGASAAPSTPPENPRAAPLPSASAVPSAGAPRG